MTKPLFPDDHPAPDPRPPSAGERHRFGSRPLFAGAIHGIRAWRLGEDGFLYSARRGAGPPWAPRGAITEASCARGARHSSPHPHCGCGLYGVHLESAPSFVADPNGASFACGVIEAWGRVELHADGFRAQFARPLALLVPPGPMALPEQEQRLRAVAALYRAETVEMPRLQHLLGWRRRRSLGLAPTLVGELVGADG